MNEESPQKVAIRLSQMLNITKGLEHFPVDVADLALSYSKSTCSTNEDRLITIQGANLSKDVDGILQKTPKGWVIIYNNSIKYSGRINFTLAHEFGHYLLHRNKYPDGLQCTKNDIYKDYSKKNIENEANTFASYLLMPLDDFRGQSKLYSFSPALFENLAKRYNTSLTATILKWIDMTDKKAIAIFSDNGFIEWKKQSNALYKTKIIPAKKSSIPEEIPLSSITHKLFYNKSDINYEKDQDGIWCKEGIKTQEIAFVSPELEFAITIVLFDDDVIPSEEDENIEYDCYDKFSELNNY